MASRSIEVALFGLFWPRYNGKIHARSVTQIPFQTVSLGNSVNKARRRAGALCPGPK